MNGAGTATADAIAVQILAGERALQALPELAPAWAELCDAAGVSPFMRPEWVQAHVQAFERPERLRLILAHCGGRLVGVLPLIAERAWMRGLPIRKLRAAANYHTLHFDLVCHPGEPGRHVAQAMWDHLAAKRDWSCIELRDVPAGGRAEWLLQAAAACPTGAWVSPIETRAIALGPGENGVAPGFQHTSRKFRAELRRTRRRLEALRELRLETVVEAGSAVLDAFFALEAAGWKGGSGGNAIRRKPPAVERFYRNLAAAAAPLGRFRLHRLHLGERVIAMSYGLQGPENFYPIRWCYDEQFAAFGPGHLLIEGIIAECAAQHLRQFAFVGEAFDYEHKWAPQGQPHAFLYIFPASRRGRLLHTLKFGGHGQRTS